MKKIIYVAVLLVSLVAISSCSKEDTLGKEGKRWAPLSEESGNNRVNRFRISPERAISTLSDFMDQMNGQLRSGGRLIQNVEAIRPSDVGLRLSNLRSGSDEGKTSGMENVISALDTLMYVVNFENEEGFALMAADERTSPIFAIIDEGSFSLDELRENPGFAILFENLVRKELNDIKNYKEDTTHMEVRLGKSDYNIHKYVKPRLKVRIWQSYPFNYFCPLKDGQKCLAGCVPVATANVVAYFQGYDIVSWRDGDNWGSTVMHWSQIEHDYIESKGWNEKYIPNYFWSLNGYGSILELAHLVRDIGNDLGVKYGVDGTSGDEGKAANWLNRHGKNVTATGVEWSYNKVDKMLEGLDGDALILMGASAEKTDFLIFDIPKGGHEWVVDGYIKATRKNSNEPEVVLFHCCLGWKNRLADGYYIANAFDTTQGPLIKEEGDDSNKKGHYNYKYFPDMSIVRRK